jgi:hypothetical protein
LGPYGHALTSLIGELSTCHYLDLEWEPTAGHDAVSVNTTFQIKARRMSEGDKLKPSSRIGRFGKKAGYNFDVGLFAEIDSEFEVSRIWRMNRHEIKGLEQRKSESPGIHVGTFRREGELAWARRDSP